jgi:hypothetical protein
MTGPAAARLTGGRFGLFADCLLIGVLIGVAAVGVVTAFPGFAAGCALLRRRIAEDGPVGVRPYARLVIRALRAGPAGVLVPVAVAVVLGLDALALAAGAPATGPLAALLVLAWSGATVLGLRTAVAWRPTDGDRWTAAARRASRTAVRDPGGSALLWLAAVSAVAIALTVPVTALLVAGPLALACVAVDGRRGGD